MKKIMSSLKKLYQKFLARKETARKQRGETIVVSSGLPSAEYPEKPVCFGVIGTGAVFDRWMHDLLLLPPAANIRVKGLAAGRSGKAEEKAAKYGIEMLYSSYEEMLRDPEINAVYVATPNHLHRVHAVQALRAGKNVLCEKPIAMNTRELREMLQAADEEGLFLMEGLWMRTLPMIQKLVKEVSRGEIGQVRAVETSCFNANSPENYPAMYSVEKGGGALMDVGCYGLHFARLFMPGQFELRQCFAIPAEGVDLSSTAIIGDGNCLATVSQSIGAAGGARAALHGTKGSIEIPLFLFPDGFTLTREDGFKVYYRYDKDRKDRPIGYAYEILHFADCLRKGENQSEWVPAEETLLIAERMEQIRMECGIILGSEETSRG